VTTAATNVVIGAASGMGAAVATLLAPRGALLLADRDDARLGEVASHLGGAVTTISCDITSAADVDAVVRATGQLGALVVTAGLSPTMASGRPIYEVNLVGTARVIRSFEPALRPGSVAVCFSSMAGHWAPASPAVEDVLDDPESPAFFDRLASIGIDADDPAIAYALSKYGVLRLVRHHVRAWGSRGGRLLSLSPGIVDTDMGRQEAAQQPVMAEMVGSSPLARMARPEEVAAVAVFLASDAASFMTGTDVLVDGGVVGMSLVRPPEDRRLDD
jgi:NAD(P)-dependent dehydrogenase (short-subunit alcohol dehydrogenase family)